jgi:Flp pilus assembly protein TadD
VPRSFTQRRNYFIDLFKELNMKKFNLSTLIALPLLSLALTANVANVLAADTATTPVENVKIDEYAAGQKALKDKNWTLAAASFKKVVADNPKNADAYNLLGYSSRWLGKYDEAFAAYDKALALDPKHKGALEYSGVAYLKVNQKAKAEAQLVKLKTICASCEETTDLAKAIAAYKP